MKEYTHIVRSKIYGTAISRHSSLELAGKKMIKRGDKGGKDPVEIINYSDAYWKKMG